MSHFMKFQCSTIYEYDSVSAPSLSISRTRSLTRLLLGCYSNAVDGIGAGAATTLCEWIRECACVCESIRSVSEIGDTHACKHCICVLCRCDFCLRACLYIDATAAVSMRMCVRVSAMGFNVWVWYSLHSAHTLQCKCKYKLKSLELNRSKCSNVLRVSIQYFIIRILLRFHLMQNEKTMKKLSYLLEAATAQRIYLLIEIQFEHFFIHYLFA